MQFALVLPLLLTVGTARADRPAAGGLGIDSVVSPGELKATPEMWFYDQAMRQYKDPKMAVRAKAEFRADQRQRRLESHEMVRFLEQPPASQQRSVPRRLLAGWVANPGYYPSRWNGVGRPMMRSVRHNEDRQCMRSITHGCWASAIFGAEDCRRPVPHHIPAGAGR